MKGYGLPVRKEQRHESAISHSCGVGISCIPVTRAQGIYLVSFSAAAFGYDESRLALAPPGRLLFAWSQESNLSQISARRAAAKAGNAA